MNMYDSEIDALKLAQGLKIESSNLLDAGTKIKSWSRKNAMVEIQFEKGDIKGSSGYKSAWHMYCIRKEIYRDVRVDLANLCSAFAMIECSPNIVKNEKHRKLKFTLSSHYVFLPIVRITGAKSWYSHKIHFLGMNLPKRSATSANIRIHSSDAKVVDSYAFGKWYRDKFYSSDITSCYGPGLYKGGGEITKDFIDNTKKIERLALKVFSVRISGVAI